MDIEVIKDINRLQDLKNEWNQLLEKSDTKSIFLTWEWLYCWWKHFKGQNQLFIIIAKSKGNGQILGIAPFYIEKTKVLGLFSVNKIKFLGTKQVGSDFLDFIIYPGKENEVLKAVYEYIKKHSPLWDVVEIGDIDHNSSSIGLLRIVLNGDFRIIEKKAHICPYLELKQNYEDLITHLSPNMRSSLKRRTKVLEEKYKVDFSIIDKKDEIGKHLNILFSLHNQRFVSKKGNTNNKSSFMGHEIINFHRDVANCFVSKGWLKFYFLTRDSDTLACLYAFKYKDRLFYFQSGLNPQWEKLSPGAVLMGYCIKDAVRDDLKEFHYLRGNEQYKKRWTKTYKATNDILIFNVTISAKTVYYFMRLKLWFKKIVKGQ